MKLPFEINILSVSKVPQLPGTWSEADYLALLNHLEFDGASDLDPAERGEYAVMALQDMEDTEAAAQLVALLIGKKLSEGQQRELAEEMVSDRMWEQHADLSLHELIFNAQVVLNQAFPSAPEPEINHLEITLEARNADAGEYLSLLNDDPKIQVVPEPTIIRCLAALIPPDAILNRLFDDQIAGAVFPEAQHLLWQATGELLPAEGTPFPVGRISLYCPLRWSDHLDDGQSSECVVQIDPTAVD